MPLCKGPTRRDFFRAGGASLFGMSMADFFRRELASTEVKEEKRETTTRATRANLRTCCVGRTKNRIAG